MTMECHGIYAIPDYLKQKMDDPAEAAYQYEIRGMAGIHFKAGKMVAREQTEEEKAEAEAGKGKKPADAKGAKKKGAEEEPTPEELEKLNAEIKEREEANAKAQGEWNMLDDNTKFFRTCEDVYKEPSIRFIREEENEEDEKPPANIQNV